MLETPRGLIRGIQKVRQSILDSAFATKLINGYINWMSDFHFINFKRVTEEPISIETIFWQILSPNPLLMYSANVKDNENADR